MDKWLQALAAIGGFAGIGVLIDLAMYKSEKANLKARLEDWWLRFDDVKWSNFGRKEAELAVQILDRLAGPRLWSWKRWRFASDATFFIFVMTMGWTVFRAKLSGVVDALALSVDDSLSFALALAGGYQFLSLVVTFAFSLTLTRYIATAVARLTTNAFVSVLTFLLIVALHILLLEYWARVVEFLILVPLVLTELDRAWSQLIFYLSSVDFEPGSRDWSLLFGIDYPTENYSGPSPLPMVDTVMLSFTLAMDVLANGLRILLALTFLSSFVFRPLIQRPISRLWYGAMDSGKPVFTTLFGILGAVVAAVQVLVK